MAFTKAQRIKGIKGMLKSKKVGAAQKRGLQKYLKKIQ